MDQQNAQGGINGHPIRLYQADDQGNPATSLAAVKKMVTQNHIVALVDGSTSTLPWGKYIAKTHVPVLGGPLSRETLTLTTPDYFPSGLTIDGLVPAIANASQNAGIKKLAVTYCSESPQCATISAPLTKAAAADGVKVVYTAAISSSAPDYTAQCLAAQQAGANGLFDVEAATVNTTLAGDCAKQNYNPIQVANDGSISGAYPTSPGMNGFVGITANSPFFVQSTPTTKQMYAAFKKYTPSILKSPNFGDGTVQQYVSGLQLGAALKAGAVGSNGASTAAQMLTGLYKFKSNTLGGTAPPLTYHPGKPTSLKCYFLSSARGGKFVLPNGIKPVCPS
jgi:branched-chain amino acid transport system substrate-binding protein